MVQRNPIVEQRVEIYHKLRENEYSSKVAALEAEQALVEARDNRARITELR